MYDRLTDLQTTKAWLKVSGNNDDAVLAQLIDAMSETVGRFCGRDNLGAIIDYDDMFFPRSNLAALGNNNFSLMMRAYPVTEIVSVTVNNSPCTILDNESIMTGQAGVYLDVQDVEPRLLRFNGIFWNGVSPIRVKYKAGYEKSNVPKGLQQAVRQAVAEVYRSQGWIGYSSKAIGGETVSFDTGDSWGLSKRTQTMLGPYRNVVPFSWC